MEVGEVLEKGSRPTVKLVAGTSLEFTLFFC
jgi:hypothetical protein